MYKPGRIIVSIDDGGKEDTVQPAVGFDTKKQMRTRRNNSRKAPTATGCRPRPACSDTEYTRVRVCDQLYTGLECAASGVTPENTAMYTGGQTWATTRSRLLLLFFCGTKRRKRTVEEGMGATRASQAEQIFITTKRSPVTLPSPSPPSRTHAHRRSSSFIPVYCLALPPLAT